MPNKLSPMPPIFPKRRTDYQAKRPIVRAKENLHTILTPRAAFDNQFLLLVTVVQFLIQAFRSIRSGRCSAKFAAYWVVTALFFAIPDPRLPSRFDRGGAQ